MDSPEIPPFCMASASCFSVGHRPCDLTMSPTCDASTYRQHTHIVSKQTPSRQKREKERRQREGSETVGVPTGCVRWIMHACIVTVSNTRTHARTHAPTHTHTPQNTMKKGDPRLTVFESLANNLKTVSTGAAACVGGYMALIWFRRWYHMTLPLNLHHRSFHSLTPPPCSVHDTLPHCEGVSMFSTQHTRHIHTYAHTRHDDDPHRRRHCCPRPDSPRGRVHRLPHHHCETSRTLARHKLTRKW